tara:strand:+ start:720 stop:992 length:273 start_codon:yes stop_codon:yes gene_type:complete
MSRDNLDLAFEEDVLNNPFSLKSWWRFLEHKEGAGIKERAKIFERALRSLPGSYKLWFYYLKERVRACQRKQKKLRRGASEEQFQLALKR